MYGFSIALALMFQNLVFAEPMPDMCELKKQSPQIQKIVNTWNADIKNSGIDHALKKHGYPIDLHTPRNSNDIATFDGACGQEYVGFFQSLPPQRDKGLDVVYEISEKGEILSKWVSPYNWYILAVDKNSIIVPYSVGAICEYNSSGPSKGKTLKISEKGDLELLDTDSFPEYKPIKCPVNDKFKDSGYKGCAIYTDISTKAERILMFEHPCT